MSVQHHAALLAYLAKVPVKVTLTRNESILVHPKRHPMKMYYKTAVNSDGKLSALKARIYADTGAYVSWGINGMILAPLTSSWQIFPRWTSTLASLWLVSRLRERCFVWLLPLRTASAVLA